MGFSLADNQKKWLDVVFEKFFLRDISHLDM